MQNSIFSTYQKWWPNTDEDLCRVNCVYLWEKYHQELTICTKGNISLSLNVITQCEFWMRFSLNIFEKFHFYSFGFFFREFFLFIRSPQNFIFLHMKIHVINSETERGHWSKKLSESISLQIYRTFQGIQANFNTAVVGMVLILPLIFNSSSLIFKPWEIVPRVQTTIGTTIILKFHWFFSSLESSGYLSFLHSLILTLNRCNSKFRLMTGIIISSSIIIVIYSSWVFHISVSWWFFTGVWVTASLLKSPGLVSVFWLSSAMLSFG